MREATSSGSTVYYFAADHLGNTSVTLDANGTKIGEMRYKPFGETRPGYPTGNMPTDRRFTGQREEDGLGSLYDYGARFYSPVLGRFISADTMVPDGKNPQAFNRYAYTANNPLKYVDPSGHCWGILSFLRDVPLYSQICPTTDLALRVMTDGNASFGDRLLASAYATVFGGSQVALVVGAGGVVCGSVAPCASAAGVAGAASADGEPLNEAQAVAGVAQKAGEAVLQLSQRMIDKLAQISTKNPESNKAVLGLWRGGHGYTELGDKLTATYLDMPDYLYINGFENFPGDFWRVNQQFLQNGIDAGKTFILETPFAEAMKYTTTNLYKEMQYLLSHGYNLLTENGVDKLVPK